MPIKVTILKENKNNINEMVEMLTPEIIAAIAAGLGVAVPVVKSMISREPRADDEFNKLMSEPMSTDKDLARVRKSIDARAKKAAKIPKSTKKALDRLAQLKAERGLNEQLLKESIVADVVSFITQNPVLLGLGAVALTTLVSKIKSFVSSPKEISYQEMEEIFRQAGIPSGEQLRLEQELRRMRAEAEFKRRRAEYEARQQPELDSSRAIPMSPEPEETGISIPIDPNDLKIYVNIMNRVSRGESSINNPKLQKLINQYGKENLDKAAEGMLYEMFKRYL